MERSASNQEFELKLKLLDLGMTSKCRKGWEKLLFEFSHEDTPIIPWKTRNTLEEVMLRLRSGESLELTKL